MLLSGQAPSKPFQAPRLPRSAGFHDDEPRPLQMLPKPLGDDLGHDLVDIVDALAPVKSQRERESRGKVRRSGGALLNAKNSPQLC